MLIVRHWRRIVMVAEEPPSAPLFPHKEGVDGAPAPAMTGINASVNLKGAWCNTFLNRYRRRGTTPQGIVLLIALVMFLLIMPWTESSPVASALVLIPFLVAIAAGTGTPVGSSLARIRWLTLPLTAGWVTARLFDIAIPLGGKTSLHLVSLLGLMIILLLLAGIFRALAMPRNDSAGVLAEAFTGYLLIALAFANLYDVLDSLLGGAFNAAVPPAHAHAHFAYFSLITLVSIGFGDIVPTHPFIRIIVALEGVCGVFYTAVIIARLTASYTPRRRSHEHPHAGEPHVGGIDDRPL